MPTLFEERKNCCGCELCASVCPKHIIQMKADSEGFYYPSISDENQCIHCNMCQRVCPVKHYDAVQGDFQDAFVGWSKAEETIRNTSSGGLATELSKRHIQNGGVVYGVCYSDDFKEVVYCRAKMQDQILALRSSKYAQSRKYDLYKQMESDLKLGRDVLFIGVPCDSAAVKIQFQNYEKLKIVSLICHGPTSPKVQKEFCETLEQQFESEITSFSVRHKKDGNWKPYYICAHFKNGKSFLTPFAESAYNTCFLYLKRPSCNDCKFKVGHYAADLLIGDFHAAQKGMDTYHQSGVSSALVLTDVGRKLLEGVEENFLLKKTPLKLVMHQTAVHSSYPRKCNRTQFAKVFAQKGMESANRLGSIKILNQMDRIKKNIKAIGSRMKKKIKSIH